MVSENILFHAFAKKDTNSHVYLAPNHSMLQTPFSVMPYLSALTSVLYEDQEADTNQVLPYSLILDYIFQVYIYYKIDQMQIIRNFFEILQFVLFQYRTHCYFLFRQQMNVTFRVICNNFKNAIRQCIDRSVQVNCHFQIANLYVTMIYFLM